MVEDMLKFGRGQEDILTARASFLHAEVAGREMF